MIKKKLLNCVTSNEQEFHSIKFKLKDTIYLIESTNIN